MKINIYARKKRQLKNLSKKLQHEINANGGNTSAGWEELILKMRRIIRQLKHALSFVELKKIMGGAAFCIPMLLSTESTAQQFVAPVQNPFGITPDSSLFDPEVADLDGDGDLDLLIGTIPGAFYYYENTGSATNPAFAAPVPNPFGLDSAYILATPELADLDNDGDLDLLSGDYFGAMEYFENTGSATNPQFAAGIVNPFGLSYTFYYSNPVLADLDNDGDLDLISGQYSGSLAYVENIGSNMSPQFDTLQSGPFGLDTFYFNLSPTITDLDGDGDFDILAGEYYGDLVFYQNNGTAANPQFADPVPNPFGLSNTFYFPNPVFADMDNDGDQDIISTEFYGNVNYFEYTDPTSVNALPALEDAVIYPNPAEDFFTLKTSEAVDEIELISLSGRTISFEGNYDGTFDISTVSSGAYFVKAYISGKPYFAGKIVKK